VVAVEEAGVAEEAAVVVAKAVVGAEAVADEGVDKAHPPSRLLPAVL